MNRRGFLELGAWSSAAVLGSYPSVATTADPSKRAVGPAYTDHAVFRSLAPGDVSAAGWLQLYLQKQARELALHLPEVSWPFTGSYWSGEEKSPDKNSWWPWEQKAYWLDGALRCALVLQDQELLQRCLPLVNYTLDHAFPDGYLGPAFLRGAKGANLEGDFRWPHMVFFRALGAQSEAQRDGRIAQAIRRHYLADRDRGSYGDPSRNVTNVEGMLWAFRQTGDRRLLEMAEAAWTDFIRGCPPGDLGSGDLHPDRVFSNAWIHSHGVTYIEKAKLPAILYLHTGNSEYLRFALAAQERIFSHHMLVDGIPSTSDEMYGEISSLNTHETCDIVDHTWTWGYLLMATGDGAWADRIERAVFNAGMGAIKKDWKALQYFSGPNQVIASQSPKGIDWFGGLGAGSAYCPNPGHESACCSGNVHRLLPNYVIRMWMGSSDGGLAAVLYGASTVQAKVGQKRDDIEIQQITDYPFDEKIRFVFNGTTPVKFPLLLRIPRWCRAPRVQVNGNTMSPDVVNGFARVLRTFSPGDEITLTLPMHTMTTYWPGYSLCLEHGPLVYALSIKEQWSAVFVEKWSTATFPEWSATPQSDWNYGIGVSETKLLGQVEIVRKPITTDPWIDPPISLMVPLKKMPGWELQSDPDRPAYAKTPPLPEPNPGLLATLKETPVERIALVPYGATHLRLTVFPSLMTYV